MTTIDIVSLIETNPITKLSSDYNSKLLTKIKNNFTNMEQQVFLSSFYCYLNYHPINDFVIDLDNIWKWIGFAKKYNSERILEKHFKLNFDYKIVAPQTGEASLCSEKWGGHNRKTILLNINCFKLFCLIAETQKAKQLHRYFIKLEDLLHEVLEEESKELKEQLTIIKMDKRNETQKAIQETIISLFPINTECIYIGTIANLSNNNETLIKFGHTNDLSKRILEHRKTYDNFMLIKAFKVQNKVEIEKLIKNHQKIKEYIRTICICDKNKTELIAYNNIFTIDNIIKIIDDIIMSKTYSIDNFNKLLRENEILVEKNEELYQKIDNIRNELTKSILENNILQDTISKQNSILLSIENDNKSVYYNSLIPENEMTQSFNMFINNMCIIHSEVEEMSTNLEGQYRIWCKTKPKKETFHAFKNYLDTRFKPIRLNIQDKNQIVHGYKGIRLKEIEYKKKHINNDVETFLFQICKFCPNGKILNSKLHEEYNCWKKSLNKPNTNNEINELKDYLNSCEYVLKSTVWTDYGSNEGYYGIMLKQDEYKYKKTSSTGKQVQKRDINNNVIICKWETIIKASQYENMSASKMSRSIKNNIIFNNEYIYEII